MSVCVCLCVSVCLCFVQSMMGPSFPVEMCVAALERCRDNMEFAAAWLLEKGYQEMDRIAKDILAKTEVCTFLLIL
jgi:hypothetical protein